MCFSEPSPKTHSLCKKSPPCIRTDIISACKPPATKRIPSYALLITGEDRRGLFTSRFLPRDSGVIFVSALLRYRAHTAPGSLGPFHRRTTVSVIVFSISVVLNILQQHPAKVKTSGSQYIDIVHSMSLYLQPLNPVSNLQMDRYGQYWHAMRSPFLLIGWISIRPSLIPQASSSTFSSTAF